MARSSQAKEPELALPFRPVNPLPPSDPTKWRKVAKNTYALGSKASVGETTGRADSASQRWRWRVIAFDGDQGTCATRDGAMRAAEFSLGLGEMEVAP